MDSQYDLRLENVSVYYGSVKALEDITFEVKNNDFIGIIGPNGGGKSTLIKALLGQVPLNSGKISINPEKTIGYVPQFAEFDQSFPICVEEVVLSGLIGQKKVFFKKYNKEDIDTAYCLMKKLGILELKEKQIGELSGGQLQKVLVARALISNPGILLLDEPTASLDVQVKKEIYEILKNVSNEVTVLIITHDIAEIFSYVKSVAYINKNLHYHGSDSKMRKNVLELTTGCPIEDLVRKEEELMEDFIKTGDKYHDQCHF
ncbi:MAG: ABC transporter ATP-binding protein [Clostridia bacterium]|nr:ABC transporter ATP-binding protein [Clostridia bacterium]